MHNMLNRTYRTVFRMLFVILSALLILQTPAVSAAEFDIPISELNKVKKKYPTRAESAKRHKQPKKKQSLSQDDKNGTGVKNEPLADQPNIQLHEKSASPPTTTPPFSSVTKSSAPADSSLITPVAESIRISHTPYSFIVPGKRTTIQAVISSDTVISNVYCYFHSTGNTLGAAVSMSKVAGTSFTYSAVIPALNSKSSGLSYKIFAVDSKGITSQSKEYTIPSSPTTFFPGWQTDNLNETLNIQLDKPNNPLDGFSDPALNK